MGGLRIEGNRFAYVDGTEKETLLDCDELILNHSCFPLQYLPGGAECLPKRILDGIKEHKVVAAGTSEECADKEYATLSMFVAREHMKTPYELKVLEIGCTSGILSYHLAKLIGRYHENSQLCCVTDTIGNESGNGWIDKIALLDYVPKLSFLATDYDCMPLPNEFFDVVIINGSVSFLKKKEMLEEACRVLKKDGLMLAYVVGEVELIHQIGAKFGVLSSYMYLEDRCILRMSAKDLLQKSDETEVKSYVKEDVLRRCEELINADPPKEELREMIKVLDDLALEAGERRELNDKVLFMNFKGKLLDELVK